MKELELKLEEFKIELAKLNAKRKEYITYIKAIEWVINNNPK